MENRCDLKAPKRNYYIKIKKGFVVLLLLSHFVVRPQLNNVTFIEDTANFFNPERGFYHHLETHSTGYLPLNLTTLQSYKNTQNISIILRLFYLDNFVNSPINAAYLNSIQQDFNTIRQAGLKCIVRFAYTDAYSASAPYGDAAKSQMLAHIQQLKPLLSLNSDIIYFVQAGFIGIWGEWYYTTHFGDPSLGPPSTLDYQNRKEVLDSLLNAVSPDIMVGIRTPLNKLSMLNYNLSDTVTRVQSHSFLKKSRIAYHNDCFMSSPNDWGTFNTTTERRFLKAESKYLLYGGEVCSVVTENDCVNAVDTLKAYNASYLNVDYNNLVISKWQTQGCYNQIQRKLGYRLVLQNVKHTPQVKTGDNLSISIKLLNKGFAAPMNKKTFELILRHQTTSQMFTYQSTTADVRYAFPNDTVYFNFNLGIGTNLVNGNYDLILNLKDIYASTQNVPSYSIRCANVGTWEPLTGFNKLSTVIVNNAFTGGSVYTGSQWFGNPVMASGVQEIFSDKLNRLSIVNVYPNPSEGDLTMTFYTNKEEIMTFSIVNVFGQNILINPSILTKAGINTLMLDFKEIGLRDGIYFLQFKVGNQTITRKLLKN